MSGFAVGGRVERASPRLVLRPVERHRSIEPASQPGPELVEVRAADPLVDRWAAFRARWSELTFYLFDPQSWR